MRWTAFRDLVREEFGENLENATPANVREFVARWYRQQMPPRREGRLLLGEETMGWEESVRHFLNGMLDLPPERAALLLWLFAMEMWYSIVACDYEETFLSLLGWEEEGPWSQGAEE